MGKGEGLRVGIGVKAGKRGKGLGLGKREGLKVGDGVGLGVGEKGGLVRGGGKGEESLGLGEKGRV